MKKPVQIVLMSFVVLTAGLFIFARLSSNVALQEGKPYITFTRMIMVASICDQFHKQYGRWPSSLSQLREFHPELKDWAKDAWGDDVWGRDLIFIPYNDVLGYGEIVDYGRDGKPGGGGADGDLVVRFPAEANADWNRQVGASLKRPERMP